MSWLHEMQLNGSMLPNHLKSLTLTYAPMPCTTTRDEEAVGAQGMEVRIEAKSIGVTLDTGDRSKIMRMLRTPGSADRGEWVSLRSSP